MTVLYVDHDMLVRRAAHASQRVIFTWGGEDFELNSLKRYVKDCYNLKKQPSVTELERSYCASYKETEVQPIAAIKCVEKMYELANSLPVDSLVMAISSKSNFRNFIKTFEAYKGNRDPHYLDLYAAEKSVRNIFPVDKLISETHHEADDVIAIHHQHDDHILSGDKDFYQLNRAHCVSVPLRGGDPKIHYVHTNGYYYFCKQLLTGDKVDNIPGLPGIGNKKAEALLKDYETDPIACLHAVKEAYSDYMKVKNESKRLGWSDSDIKVFTGEYFKSNATLLWLTREPGVMFSEEAYKKYYKC